MGTRHGRGPTLALALALAAGCVGGGKGVPADEPDVAGKADFMDRVTVRGELELAANGDRLVAEATGSFAEDFEFHGYTLMTRGDAELRVEVTQRGTSRGLDTTLYVYGPRTDGRGYESRIAFDDDGGYGKLSRVEGLVVPANGQYLIVVGTYSGLGRGSYRLEVECVSGDCLDVEVPATCPDRVATDINDCVDEWLAEGDYEDTRHEAFAACTTDYAGDFYEYACASSWHAPEPWCPAGMEAFLAEIMPACVTALAPLYPEDRDPLGFARRDLGEEIENRLAGSSDWSMGARGESFTVLPPESGEEITFEWVLDSVRQGSDHSSLYSMRGEVGVAAFDRFGSSYGLGDDFVALLRADAGTERFRLGQMSASWYCAAGAECWVDLFVFHFDNDVVTTIEFAAGED